PTPRSPRRWTAARSRSVRTCTTPWRRCANTSNRACARLPPLAATSESPMIPHTGHVARHVDDYLHDLLDADTASHVTRHCAECPTCAAALEDAQRRLAALQTVPPSEA